MTTQQPEILLLNFSHAASGGQRNSFDRFNSRVAPLGLHCLAAIDNTRIMVVDALSLSHLVECLNGIDNGLIRAVIVSLPASCQNEIVAPLLSGLRSMFPAAVFGCAPDHEDIVANFDFVIRGTGKTAILRLLRGDRLRGYFDTVADDLLSPLPVPEETPAPVGYELETEKWLGGKTIEIFQPWLGLLDQRNEIFTYPGLLWLAAMVGWLQKSAYAAFHFSLSGLCCDNLHELRSVMLNLKARFAVSFTVEEFKHITAIGYPLQQIWLHDVCDKNAAAALEIMKQISQAGCQPCLLIDRRWLTIAEPQALLAGAERIVISDLSSWPAAGLKRLIGRFWSFRSRFFMRLFGLKKASELIVFMKTAYFVLEVLFLSENSGRGEK